jgi:hypothetical protein
MENVFYLENTRDYKEVPVNELRKYDHRMVPLRNSKGSLKTAMLFDTPANKVSEETVFTMRRSDHYVNGFYLFSFRKLFMSIPDFTGYKQSIFLFDDHKHLLKLKDNKLLSEFIEDCFSELEMKYYSESLETILNQAASGDIKAISAARFIVEEGYKNKSKKGRPSNEEIAGNLKQETEREKKFLEDAARIGIRATN